MYFLAIIISGAVAVVLRPIPILGPMIAGFIGALIARIKHDFLDSLEAAFIGSTILGRIAILLLVISGAAVGGFGGALLGGAIGLVPFIINVFESGIFGIIGGIFGALIGGLFHIKTKSRE